jgi:DnaK suppressor protein
LIDRFRKFKLFRGINETFFIEVDIIGLIKAGRLFGIQTMTDSLNLENFHMQLQESLEEIEQYLAKTAESAEVVSPDKGLGRLSRMEAMQDQQLILAAGRRKKMQKVEVLSALQRLENGIFGTCIFCGKPIAVERLEVAPEATTCVNCS